MLRKFSAGVSISLMTIGFSDDIDLAGGCSQISVAQASRLVRGGGGKKDCH